MAERLTEVDPKDNRSSTWMSIGSAFQVMLPNHLQLVGKSHMPSHVPVRWRNAHRPSADSTFLEFERREYERGTVARRVTDPGSLPSQYGQVGILKIDREAMDRLAARGITRPAAAFALGSATVYGVTHVQDILGLESPDAEEYEIAMRIGPPKKGPLYAQVGVQVAIRQALLFPSPAGMYMPLAEGIRPGEVMPESEVPHYIPIV